MENEVSEVLREIPPNGMITLNVRGTRYVLQRSACVTWTGITLSNLPPHYEIYGI